MFLPGAVLPGEVAYPGLLAALGEGVDAIYKELEVYAGAEPPAGYSLDVEVEGILREAEKAGFDRFHLVGYSAGGAVSLAFAAAHRGRLLSLGLLEPAWAGNEGLDPVEVESWRKLDQLLELPPAERMPAFIRANLRPGVEPPPPPPGEPPPWMAKRPAGLAALTRAFKGHTLDGAALANLGVPVYYALGSLSNPDHYGKIAERLAGVFADFTLEEFADRHHFDPPHRAEPERLAASLRALWARG